jgi:hypothetical protein
VLDERNSHGIKAVVSSPMGRSGGRSLSLWDRPPGVEKSGSRLCGTLQDGSGGAQEPHHVHPGDTRDIPRKRCVCGAIKLGGPEISDSCEVSE